MANETSAIKIDAPDHDDRVEYEKRLHEAIQHLEALPVSATPTDKARINLDIAEAKTGLGQTAEAWELARSAFDTFIENENWQDAIESCEVMYQTGEPANITALCHGIWLSVTYPVKPQTTITMVNYMIDETPDNSDGAAVAATVAHYIAGIRANDAEYESLSFLTRNMLVKVAERHSQIKSQEELDMWMMKLELNDPAVFLPRLGRVLEIIVIDQWWIDRDALRSKLPDQ
jgi:hypothetical protein